MEAQEIPSIMNHVSLSASDGAKSSPIYDAVLAKIGAKRLMAHEDAIVYGKMFPEFWVHTVPFDGGKADTASGVHFAFFAHSEKMVKEFYEVALANDGTDDGPLGPRPLFGVPYYGYFVRDPDGHKIEAAFRDESKV